MMKAVVALLAIAAVLSGASAQTFHSGGTCVAKADASVWKLAQDGCAHAFAKAYVDACSATSFEQLYAKCYDDMHAVAKVIVNIRVSAVAHCTTTGYTFGCATARAWADAQTQAVIKLVSKAAAAASNNCPHCDPLKATAIANIMSTLIVQLDTQAQAYVKAKVCVGPNSSALAKAYANCCTEIVADGLAKAFAKAVISGDCTGMHGAIKAKALAQVDNIVKITTNKCACSGFALACSGSGCHPVYKPPSPTVYFNAYNPWPVIKATMVSHCHNAVSQVQ